MLSRSCWTAVVGLALLAACSPTGTEPMQPLAHHPAFDTQAPISSSTVVVSPADLHGWTFFQDPPVGTGTYAFVNGPASAPLGSGSLQLDVDGTGRANFATAQFAGTRLADITALSYSTFRGSPSDGVLAISLQFTVDYDGTDANDAWQGYLVYEPYHSHPAGVTSDSWQTWNTLNDSWWATGAPGNATCPQSSPCSWAAIVAAFPNAVIRPASTGFSVVQLKAGGPWGIGFSGNADQLIVGVSGVETTFDFEPALGACGVNTDAVNKVLTLDADCTTDHTLFVPDGWTLDGASHTVTAVDPASGHFLGAVIRNAGTSANVRNVTVTATGLQDVCDAGDDRLRGILFQGAGGTIAGNTVTGVRQGFSGCQEGSAIEVRNDPFDLDGNTTVGPNVTVTISGNTIGSYQKNGITANGSVTASITGNTITGDGPITYIAQNGIQVGFGATAVVEDNLATGNNYTPEGTESCGLLMYLAHGVKSRRNQLSGNEVNNCNYGKGGGNVSAGS